jgi:hypothetical protein
MKSLIVLFGLSLLVGGCNREFSPVQPTALSGELEREEVEDGPTAIAQWANLNEA